MADFSLIKFFQQFPTEEKSAEYFKKLRWGEVVVCPYCGSVHISRTKLNLLQLLLKICYY